MTEYREQAIKDMRSCYNLKDFAVAQRERVLRLEEGFAAAERLLKQKYKPWMDAGGGKECSHGISTVFHCRLCDIEKVRELRAALEAVKEG